MTPTYHRSGWLRFALLLAGIAVFLIIVMVAALLLTVAAPAQKPDLIVDQCDLTEYRQECDFTVDESQKDQLQACYAKAAREATRIRAGVTADCLVPGAPAKVGLE